MKGSRVPDILPCPFDAGAGTLVEVESLMEIGFGFPTYCVCVVRYAGPAVLTVDHLKRASSRP